MAIADVLKGRWLLLIEDQQFDEGEFLVFEDNRVIGRDDKTLHSTFDGETALIQLDEFTSLAINPGGAVVDEDAGSLAGRVTTMFEFEAEPDMVQPATLLRRPASPAEAVTANESVA